MAINNTINTASKVTQFTSSGTWTKDTRTQSIMLFGTSGSSGGGSGRQGLTTAAGGGAGGPSGSCLFYALVPALAFDTSETVTIGSGGTGGTGQTSDLTDGNSGSVGSSTSIGNVTCVAQTNVSPGGTTTSAFVGANGNSYMLIRPATGIVLTNYAGGPGSNTAGGSTSPNTSFTYCGSSGSGGGGADVSTARVGGAGGDLNLGGSTILTGGTAGDPSGTIDGGSGNNGIATNGVLSCGTGGGGGGGQNLGVVAGNGGNGGTPGGGGGGGGGSISGTTSGAGGNGQRGELWVVEFF